MSLALVRVCRQLKVKNGLGIRWRTYTSRKLNFADIGGDQEAELLPLQPLDPPPPTRPQGDTMIKYIYSVMSKYPEAIVMTQVGSFYELYFEHATEYGPKLDFKVAQKRQYNPVNGSDSIPMIGFPLSQLQKYTTILVKEWGKNVVVLSQQQDQVVKKSSEQLKRPISRIVTPGTLIEEDQVDTFQQNFVCCVFAPSNEPEDIVAVAWVDLGDGSIYYQTTITMNLEDTLSRINPREVVLDTKSPVKIDRLYVTRHKFPPRDALLQYRYMVDVPKKSLRDSADKLGVAARAANGALLSYLHETMPNTMYRFKMPKQYLMSETLQMDRATISALELFKTSQRDSKEGSLFSIINRTITPSGSRLLQEYMTAPSRNKETINWRLDMVDLFKENGALRDQTAIILKTMPDGKRTIQKLGQQRPSPHELLQWSQIVDCIALFGDLWEKDFPKWAEFLKLARADLQPLANDIITKLSRGKDEEATENISFVRQFELLINPKATPKFKQLGAEKQALAARFQQLADKYKTRYHENGDASLRYSPHHGYYCTLKFKQGDWRKVLENTKASVLSQTKQSVSFNTPEITELGSLYESCLRKLEQTQGAIIEKLRLRVLETTSGMRECLDIIDTSDVLHGFAVLAIQRELCRPALADSPVFDVRGGRNLTVESGLLIEGGKFTSNDILLSEEKPIVMITGPNMGGKSTYIRQVALVSLLAQMGCFVPAESALVGLVDRIFCRVGSGDDISRGRSTFLVEMMETSMILRLATENSLALLDEVGRGTSENDGVAIAYASMKYMLEFNKCRAVFSTHYGPELHQALESAKLAPRVDFVKTAPQFSGSTIHYSHKLTPGICSEAHGLEMAKLAGFPEHIMNKARSVYNSLN